VLTSLFSFPQHYAHSAEAVAAEVTGRTPMKRRGRSCGLNHQAAFLRTEPFRLFGYGLYEDLRPRGDAVRLPRLLRFGSDRRKNKTDSENDRDHPHGHLL
jgi:hypothetical protein